MPLFPGSKDCALFLYGFDINNFNQYINFKAANAGPVLTATIPIGNYTCTQFMQAISDAMGLADGANTYTVTLDRTRMGGLSNAMTVSTSGSFLSILFGTGPNASSSPAGLMGFNSADYTGGLMYTGSNPAGIILIPELPIYNYNSPQTMIEQDGVKNVSATGVKETLVFAKMQFFQGEWKYITDNDGSGQLTAWANFLQYATQQLQFEFQPSIYEDPTVFYQCTLESTPQDGDGMKYTLDLQVSEGLYRFYQTGKLKFRIVVT